MEQNYWQYIYLAQNKLPSSKSSIGKIKALVERHVLLDSLPFKLITIPEKETALLAIPEMCTDKIITLYCASVFAGHQGIKKTYLTIADEFIIPDLMHYLHFYIKGCHICQLTRKDKPPTRQLQKRINLNYRPLSRLSMDLKVMLKSYTGHKFILCIIDEVTNYLITVPISHSRPQEICDALIENIISKYFIPDYIITDQDSAFMSMLISYLFKRLNIKIFTSSNFST